MIQRPFVCSCKTIAVFIIAGAIAGAAYAQDGPVLGEAQLDPHSEMRSGGVLAHSYGYHRQSPTSPTTVAPAAGWYGYGFPVKTHRWGWFGATHYYPTVVWHHGYLGDHKRWAYRRGY